ncbi:hypothetical protein EDWATA_01335 [Edwardsiella tarda ATCC 23685]|uniref:Uncharacterized protein n=1 Tax=Edwardsiella tarda ATCC 23685 TaxID=500638 RepID=D4F3M5_EDWTA|nr:hypothetical protein EDWATA_01335 [Edwardsiella tarda ATCC 23685]
MRVRINSQMQFPSDTTAFFAIFFDFPLTFAEDFQPCGINHQMRYLTSGGCFKTDINRLCPLADTGVIRTAQRNPHQGKIESIKLCAARMVCRKTRLTTRTVVIARAE